MKTRSVLLGDRLKERRKKAHIALKKQRARILDLKDRLITDVSRKLKSECKVIIINDNFFLSFDPNIIKSAIGTINSRIITEVNKYDKFKLELFKTVSRENINDMNSDKKTDPVLAFCYALKERDDNLQSYDTNVLQYYITNKIESLRMRFDTKSRLSELEEQCLITSEMRQAAEQLLFSRKPTFVLVRESRNDVIKVVSNTRYDSLVDLVGKEKADKICELNDDLTIYAKKQFESYIGLLSDVVRNLGEKFDNVFSENPNIFSSISGIRELSRVNKQITLESSINYDKDLDSMLSDVGYDFRIVNGIIEGGFRAKTRGFIGSIKISYDSVKKNFKPYLGEQITADITNTFYRLVRDGVILSSSSKINRGPYSINPRTSDIEIIPLKIYLENVLGERHATRGA